MSEGSTTVAFVGLPPETARAIGDRLQAAGIVVEAGHASVHLAGADLVDELDVDGLVLAVARAPDRRIVSDLLRAGAAGVVDVDEPAIAVAVAAVAAGLLVVPRSARGAFERLVLTTRQKQILGLLVLGLSNREIAERLFLAEPTVKMHLTAIFAKLGVRNRNQAVELVLDPASGMGTGIVQMLREDTPQGGYGGPAVR